MINIQSPTGAPRRLRLVFSILGASVLAFGSLAGASAQPAPPGAAGRPEFVDDELLVKFRPGTSANDEAAAHRQVNAHVVREIAALNVKVVRVGTGQALQRLASYRHNPNVDYVELNGIAYPTWAPNDDFFMANEQWALNNIGVPGGTVDIDIDAPQAWDVTRGSSSVAVAIVDSGITLGHEDLKNPDGTSKVIESRNWYDGTASDDPYGHGTHVAGIAAAATNNNMGVAGVCPDCTLLNAKVCDNFGGCPYDRIANGILWSVGCEWRDARDRCLSPVRSKAINVSIAGTYNSLTLQSAVDRAWNRGAVLACAAGNAGTNTRHYPAAYSNCIAVAATDANDLRPAWSNYGSGWVDVAAPGVNIVSTMNPEGQTFADPSGYGRLGGTSMASPHVAGLAGLLWSKAPTSTNKAIRTQIESTALAISGTGTLWSKGRINACKAVGGSSC